MISLELGTNKKKIIVLGTLQECMTNLSDLLKKEFLGFFCQNFKRKGKDEK